jgi:Tfp pilus assembly protein PilO
MIFDWRPWRQMLPVWLPAVVLALVLIGVFFYQTSDSVGRKAVLADDIEELGAEVERLRKLHEAVTADRQEVEELQIGFQDLNDRVFSDLDVRLTRILRAVGTATREAGLLPGTYTYAAKNEKRLGYVRFGIGFQVIGEYAQIRKMLASLQASPEFLIVDGLSLTKSDDLASRSLNIGVRISTYLGEVDPDRLHRLTGGIVETDDEVGPDEGSDPDGGGSPEEAGDA